MARAAAWLLFLLLAAGGVVASEAAEPLIGNGDFEKGLDGWRSFWSRDGVGKALLDDQQRHSGRQAVRIEHPGRRDWSFGQARRLPVEPGQIYKLQGWVRVRGEGTATLCVILRDQQQDVIDWAFGGETAGGARDGWQLLQSRFVIPRGGRSIEPRLIGSGPATVWLDDVSLVLESSVAQLRGKSLPDTLAISNRELQIVFRTADATLSIVDRRSGRRWNQWARHDMVTLQAEQEDRSIAARMLDPATMLELAVRLRLPDDGPEVEVDISSDGKLPRAIAYPHPFVSGAGTFLIMPVNEGISYPVDDPTLRPMRYHLFGGHGLCMGWYGVTDGGAGLMTIVHTPDDAVVDVPRHDGRLCLAPQWLAQKGQFGYTRKLRYVLFHEGGYVAMCKRYRRQAQQEGRLVTLAEKRKAIPYVDQLVGAVNVWCWDRDPVEICRQLQAAGIKRILWSHRSEPSVLRQLNDMGVLTSRYDIYQDVMNPANFPKLRGVHRDWPTEAWPDDLMLDEHGQWRRGWRVKGKDGQWYPCGVLCDRRAVDYARRRIPAELKTHPYHCRFIDTTTASPWRECYHPDHPMTRSESRHWKMQLLNVVSHQCGLVTGSETGHEAAVPYLHYFEGMMSLGPYRVPDAGRQMAKIWDEVPERVAKFQTGHYYRLPLWELVYHDCVVSYWYWGDYNNKLPAVWDRRDLLNALYGTPPMFMFNRQLWQQQRERFVQSYRTAAPVARATGYVEMLSHRWLTGDHAVQQTQFANGVEVTVNFGPQPYTLPDGATVLPMGHRIKGFAD